MDRLNVVYTGPNKSFTTPSGLLSGHVRCFYTGSDMSFYYVIRAFNVDQLDVIYTGPYRSFTVSSGLFKWVIAKIDRECFK